jgi:glycosyltransferase involved in cell wall biosynthesis
MLAGLPVVSTVHSGIPEVVEHGRTGWLVPEHDIAGMADGVLHILNDRSLAMAMGQAGKARIMEEYSKARHLSVLRTLLHDGADVRLPDGP